VRIHSFHFLGIVCVTPRAERFDGVIGMLEKCEEDEKLSSCKTKEILGKLSFSLHPFFFLAVWAEPAHSLSCSVATTGEI
jgi:hypothetical protein